MWAVLQSVWKWSTANSYASLIQDFLRMWEAPGLILSMNSEKVCTNWASECTSIVPARRSLRQEDCMSQVSLAYVFKCHKNAT